MNLLRYFKKKLRDGDLPNPIGLLSTRIPSRPSYAQTVKLRLKLVQLSSTRAHIIGS